MSDWGVIHSNYVIPSEAGIQSFYRYFYMLLDTRFRRHDKTDSLAAQIRYQSSCTNNQ